MPFRSTWEALMTADTDQFYRQCLSAAGAVQVFVISAHVAASSSRAAVSRSYFLIQSHCPKKHMNYDSSDRPFRRLACRTIRPPGGRSECNDQDQPAFSLSLSDVSTFCALNFLVGHFAWDQSIPAASYGSTSDLREY